MGYTAREVELIDELYLRRTDLDLSIAVVERAMGVQGVSKWEDCAHFPRLDNFVAWADVLDYDVVLVPRPQSQRGPKKK